MCPRAEVALAVKFPAYAGPWSPMPSKRLQKHPDTQQSQPPAEGPFSRPIRCAVSSANAASSLCRGAECYRIHSPNPVALPLDCLCGSERLHRPGGEGKLSGADMARRPAFLGAASLTGGMAPPPGESLATRRRRIAAERAAAQAEAHDRARADGTNALGHSPEFVRDVGLAVLTSAYATAASETGVVQHPRVYCLEAGGGGIGGHYALRLLGHLESRPYAHREVLAVLAAGIVQAGGTLPPPPKPPRRKTGPKVTWGPPNQAEVERRRALLAAALERVKPLLMLLAPLVGE